MASTYSLEFNDIIYEVKNRTVSKDKPKWVRLIHGISGKFESGKVTAIMGPSGSCKSTFLNAITGRIEENTRTNGNILFKGAERDIKTWSGICGYLEQFEETVPKISIRNMILFHARTKNVNLPIQVVEKSVDDAMRNLGLYDIRDKELHSASKGEKKRAAIAAEFASGSEVLILDEPMSGLDSYLSVELLLMLKRYAKNENKIVVLTIHQPGSGLFELLDDLYFLYKGICIFKGPVSDLSGFLESHKFEVMNDLSKPEFLFEVFSRRSIFFRNSTYECLSRRNY